MKVVTQCRKEFGGPISTLLKSLHKQSLFLFVSLVISYLPGQLFSLLDMHSAINTFYGKRKLSRIDMNSMCSYGEQLLQDNLLHCDFAGERKPLFSSLNQYQSQAMVLFNISLLLYSSFW